MYVFAKPYEIRIKEQIIPSECIAFWRGEDVIFQVKFYTDSAEEHAINTAELRGMADSESDIHLTNINLSCYNIYHFIKPFQSERYNLCGKTCGKIFLQKTTD